MVEQRSFERLLFSATGDVIVVVFENAETCEVRKDLLVWPEVDFPGHDFPEVTVGSRRIDDPSLGESHRQIFCSRPSGRGRSELVSRRSDLFFQTED